MNIGQKIRTAREHLGLSQSDVSHLIPMNQSNYSKIERNLQEPSMEQLKRICEILHLDPRYLLGLGEMDLLTPKDLQLLKQIKDIINNFQQK